jgi:hypothetical protein
MLSAISHEPNPREPDQQHCPCGGLGLPLKPFPRKADRVSSRLQRLHRSVQFCGNDFWIGACLC